MTKQTLKKLIEEVVEENSDMLIEYCTRLINHESVTGNEYNVQLEVKKIMEEIGLKIDFWEPDDKKMRNSKLFSETGESFKNRPVAVGILEGNNTGKSLLVNGHVDVVNESPIQKWNTDPFEAVIKDGKIYGRGASDMKSGVAMTLFAVTMIKKLGNGVGGDITIVSVPGEENGGNGTVASVLRGYNKADAAVYPEPTSNQIQPAHRGAAFWRIHIEGKASHGGTKYKGVSAVEKGIIIAKKLMELEKWRDKNISKKHPMYHGYPISAPITLGKFNGGQFTSGVPETCILEGCIEYIPGEKSKDVQKMFESTIEDACKDDKWLQDHPPKVEWFGLLYEPAETDSNHPFVKEFKNCFESMTGEKATVNGFEAGTDMRILSNEYGIPGLMFGPGDLAMAHAPNEYVNIDELIKGAKVLIMLMADWCKII